MSTVKKLEVKNILGVHEVNIQPKNDLVIIAGDNAQGKTSVIRSLEMALMGKKAMAGITKVVHEGEEDGDIIADLGDVIIKRHYKDDGKERLKVTRGSDGTDIRSPQGLLDRMYNKMLKPVTFMQMKPKEQKELLINSLPLDINLPEMMEKRQEVYDLRTVKGRERDNARAHLEKMEPPESWEDMPEDEINVTDLVKELEKRKDHNLKIESSKREVQEMKQDIEDIDERIADLKKQIQDLETKKEKIKGIITDEEKWQKTAEPMDENEVREKIDKVEAQNIRIREARKYREFYDNVMKLNSEYSNLTQEIGKIDKTVEKALARADLPLEGLEIYDDGLGINGIPLAQIAESDQLKAAVDISMGLKPEPSLKILIIENGRDINEAGREYIKKRAKEKGYQIWMQYVDDSGEIGIVIEEGRVAKINE